jgi:hypothetical protein
MFQHVAAKALLPKAALLIWSAPGLRENYKYCLTTYKTAIKNGDSL